MNAMSNERIPSGNEHFIPLNVRPDVGADLDRYPSVDPNAGKEELKRLACEVLGEPEQGGAADFYPDNPWNLQFDKSSGIHWVELSGETVLFSFKNSCYYNLNRVGTVIWGMLNGEQTLAAILRGVRRRYEVEEDDAREDLLAFVSRLREEQLITERG
jgi:hypothetical protein